MSIYHRYALFYRIQRYQADVDRLGDLVSKCEIVDDFAEHSDSIDAGLSATNTACEGPSRDPDIAPSRNDGKEDATEKQEKLEDQSDQEADTDKKNCKPLDDDNESQTDNKCLELPDAQLHGEDEPTSSTESESGETSTPSTNISSVASAGSGTDDGPRFKITRAQLNRLRTCDRILKRLNNGLVKNINRIEKEEKELSSQTISHFWGEAARLKGTEKIKSLRSMEREMANSGWWEDEPSREDTEDTVQVLGNMENAARPVPKPSPRKPSSPLHRQLQPDDMLWDDEKSKWHLDMGRLMDDQGKRYLKI